ncbi:hypothetical protein Fcan01_11464, partial [Folsomia candida]
APRRRLCAGAAPAPTQFLTPPPTQFLTPPPLRKSAGVPPPTRISTGYAAAGAAAAELCVGVELWFKIRCYKVEHLKNNLPNINDYRCNHFSQKEAVDPANFYSPSIKYYPTGNMFSFQVKLFFAVLVSCMVSATLISAASLSIQGEGVMTGVAQGVEAQQERCGPGIMPCIPFVNVTHCCDRCTMSVFGPICAYVG